MTKSKAQQPATDAPDQPRAGLASGEEIDAWELLLAELQTRRQRLQQLLKMVEMNAGIRAPRRASSGFHPTCEERNKRSA